MGKDQNAEHDYVTEQPFIYNKLDYELIIKLRRAR